MNAAPPRAAPPQAPSHIAPFLRRSVAWLVDAAVLATIATAATWPWVAPASMQLMGAARALVGGIAQRLVDAMLAGAQPAAMMQTLLRDPALLSVAARVQNALWAALAPWTLAYAVLAFAWHLAGDLSPWRGSPGKRWLGLRVEHADGGAATPAQAAMREAGSALSWLTLNLGHALALVPPRRQSLHDRIAGTRVVRR